jgi:hypothetical protein
MEKELIDNHQKYLERPALFKSHGYDLEKERSFIVEQAKPLRGQIIEADTGKRFSVERTKSPIQDVLVARKEFA